MDKEPVRIRDATADLKEFAMREYGMDPLAIAIESDISPDGTYSSGWLVSDGTAIAVIRLQGASFFPEARLELASLRGIQVREFSGCGSLEVMSSEGSRELLRFSSSRVAKFEAAAEALSSALDAAGAGDADREDSHEPAGEAMSPTARPSLHQRLGPRMKYLWRLVSYVGPYRRLAVLLSVLMLVGSALRLIPPYFIKTLVDDVLKQGQGRPGRLITIVLIIIGSQAAATAIAIVRARVSAWLGGRISKDLRSQLYSRIQFHSMSFFDRKTTGAVVANMTQDTRTLHTFCVEIAGNFVVNILLLIGISAMLFYLNPLLAILVFVPLPIVILLIRTFLKRLMTRFRGLWQAWMYLYRIVDTTISGIRLVKAFGQETREIDRFEHMNLGLFEREWEANRAVSLYFPILTLVMTSGTFVIWLVGGLDVMSGKITMGSLLAFIAYAAMLYGPLQALGGIGERISRAMTSTQRVFEVLDTIPEIQDAEDAAAITTVMGEISYDHVTFGYDKHRPVLHDICLHVRPGEMIGLVGHSGAGKSTMMNLLCRFYDVDKGAVRIDGIDVKKIKNEDLHRAIGIVPQDTFLFEGSVAENISYAKPDAPAEAIIHAAVASNAHDFVIKLEDAYDSQVGERGHKFSRGQRQMISIARAILSDPSILVLDEPTSSVDLETEEKIQQALSRLTEGKTTFSIAHRLSTLRDCDRLFVLKEGRAVESGTHEELVSRKDSVYRGLADVYSKVSSAGHIPDEV